jgi:DNA topoisomerase-2
MPMIPYYKNFRGTIEKIDESKFLMSGEAAILDDENNNKNEYSIEISELPVGVWTQVYKETVLEVFLHGTEPSTSSSSSKLNTSFQQLINDYKEYHTDCTVSIC